MAKSNNTFTNNLNYINLFLTAISIVVTLFSLYYAWNANENTKSIINYNKIKIEELRNETTTSSKINNGLIKSQKTDVKGDAGVINNNM